MGNTVDSSGTVTDVQHSLDVDAEVFIPDTKLDLIKDNRKECDPREAILQDLTAQLSKDKERNIEVMVIGDTNEDVVTGKRIGEFLEEAELYNVIKENHPGTQVATYDRG